MKYKLLAASIGVIALGGCVSSSGGSENSAGLWSKTQSLLTSDVGNAVLGVFGGQSEGLAALTQGEVGSALKEALRIGTSDVVSQLGVQNGFNLDPQIRIPLPGALGKVDKTLSKIGLDALTDDLELRLNRAAEAATPKAKELFLASIQQMTFQDAKNILTGPQDAATTYLRRTMGEGLSQEMQPIVQEALAQAGAIRAYDSMMGQYQQIPFVPDVKANLQDYVVEKAMDGVFYYVAQEEAAIRANPAKRSTELLKKVFGAL